MDGPRVLIADDDPQLVEVLSHRCRAMGLKVDAAGTAMEALQRIEVKRPAIVILDVDMPCGSGFGVCEMMSHHDQYKQIPIIMLTGKKDPETIRRCYDLSVFYVAKCGDVWPRIQPLLEELLELKPSLVDSAPAPERAPAPSSAKPAPADMIGAAHKPLLEAPVIDQIFAALGFGDEVGPVDVEIQSSPSRRPWILCVDDDPELANGLELRLREHGVAVERACNGREGYRRAFLSPARAILLDYEMPEGNGVYVLRRLKENPFTKDIPVIVVTGCRDWLIERQMYEMGAVAYVKKPYKWSQLWDELRPHLWPEPAPARREQLELATV